MHVCRGPDLVEVHRQLNSDDVGMPQMTVAVMWRQISAELVDAKPEKLDCGPVFSPNLEHALGPVRTGSVAADIVLLYAREDERQMGQLIEAGCALGAGKTVFLVAPWAKWSQQPSQQMELRRDRRASP